MKRGSLLLVFVFGIFFVGVFSFLPIVSGHHCDFYKNSHDCIFVAQSGTQCVGSEVTSHYCYWESLDADNYENGYCISTGNAETGEDCAGKKDTGFCVEFPEVRLGMGPSFSIYKYNGICAKGHCDLDVIPCLPNQICVPIKNNKAKCTTQAALDALLAEETITSDEETGLSSLKFLLVSKPLIFKTALAVLLVALILVIFIYFKPKKKKRK